jgi:hypothetical protein
MKKVLFTLAALLTSTAIISASDGSSEVVDVKAPTSEPVAIAAPVHHKHHKDMTLEQCKKDCDGMIAKAKEWAGKITEEKYKIMADHLVVNMEGTAKLLTAPLTDADHKFISTIHGMNNWSLKQVAKIEKDAKKAEDAAKKKAEAAESKKAKSAKSSKPKTKAVSRAAGKKTTRVVKKK